MENAVIQRVKHVGLAGAALAAGTAAHLLLHPQLLKAARAHHAQAPQRLQLCPFRFRAPSVVRRPAIQLLLECLCLGVAGNQARGGQGQFVLIRSFGLQALSGLQKRIAAQADIRAAVGHGGGHRYRAALAGMAQDPVFQLLVLGVDQRGVHAPALQQTVDLPGT